MRGLAERDLTERSLGRMLFSKTGLEAWVRAEDLSSSPVATWPDISGNGNDFTQATGANQPTLESDVLNGYPAVLFDGSNDSLGSSLDIVQPVTFAGVVMVVGGSGERTAFGSRNPASTGQPGAIFYTPSTDYTIFAGNNLASTVAVASGWVRGVGVYSGASSRFFINTEEKTGNPNTRGAGLIMLGGYLSSGSPASFWNGYIAEFLAWSRALGQDEMRGVLTYFEEKYDLSGA